MGTRLSLMVGRPSGDRREVLQREETRPANFAQAIAVKMERTNHLTRELEDP
jgi:hypothetical protein